MFAQLRTIPLRMSVLPSDRKVKKSYVNDPVLGSNWIFSFSFFDSLRVDEKVTEIVSFLKNLIGWRRIGHVLQFNEGSIGEVSIFFQY